MLTAPDYHVHAFTAAAMVAVAVVMVVAAFVARHRVVVVGGFWVLGYDVPGVKEPRNLRKRLVRVS